jgi:hypothetical protein
MLVGRYPRDPVIRDRVLLRAEDRQATSTIVDTDAIRYKVHWRNGRGELSWHARAGLTVPRLDYGRGCHDIPAAKSTRDGRCLRSLGGRQVKVQIGDAVQVGKRVGTITDVGTTLLQFKTNDGCLHVACPWEVVRIPSLPQGVRLQL